MKKSFLNNFMLVFVLLVYLLTAAVVIYTHLQPRYVVPNIYRYNQCSNVF